jgi:hypothetical protein
MPYPPFPPAAPFDIFIAVLTVKQHTDNLAWSANFRKPGSLS